jgi:S-adenosylmethionine:tRNA ribosyltransferase-isomerase
MQQPLVHPASLEIKNFCYHLPEEQIARYPARERDSARLLIYNGRIAESTYLHIGDFLPDHSLMVFNQTKVVNARLMFKKPTGGKIEVFCLEPDERYPDVHNALSQTRFVYWKCLVGGASKWKAGQELDLEVPNLHHKIVATLADKGEGYYIIKITWNTDISFAELLQEAGAIPLPPYLNRAPEASDLERYQTMFAQEEGSVAAPTAALHFTPRIIERLGNKNIDTNFVTLHVGAGTFKPVKSETMETHEMHAEWIEVSEGLVQKLIGQLKQGLPIIATGTTTARTLESLYWIGFRLITEGEFAMNQIAVAQWYPYQSTQQINSVDSLQAVSAFMQQQGLERLVTRTQIIIAPGYEFKVIDALVTNFHQPQSTLLLLVAALIGKDWQEVYAYALEHNFRFLSYGDGSLLWAKKYHSRHASI